MSKTALKRVGAAPSISGIANRTTSKSKAQKPGLKTGPLGKGGKGATAKKTPQLKALPGGKLQALAAKGKLKGKTARKVA